MKPGPAGMQTLNNLQPEWSTFEKPENEIFPAAKFCQLRGGGNLFSESSHVSVCSLNSIISFSDSQSVMFFFRCVRRLGFFEHGCLCEVNVLIYRRRICRSVICRRVWAHRVFMYTDRKSVV